MTVALAILSAILFSFIEGIREYHFYQINREADFRLEQSDKTVKTINAAIAVILHAALLFLFGLLCLIPVTLAIRLIVLDGTLNVKRGFSFWDVGVRDFFKVLKGREWQGKLLILILSIAFSIIVHIKTNFL